MQSLTMSCPARYAPSTKEVCAPFKMRTFLCLYGLWLSVIRIGSPALSTGNSSLMDCGPSITQKPKISPVSMRLSSYPSSSQIAFASFLGYPVTIRSTRVEQKIFSALIHAMKSSPRFHCLAYFNTHFSSYFPLLSISSQARMMNPFPFSEPNFWKRRYKNCVSFPG